MPLFPLLIFIAVMALIWYGIRMLLPESRWKLVAYWVIGIFAVIWIANYIGLVAYLKGIRI